MNYFCGSVPWILWDLQQGLGSPSRTLSLSFLSVWTLPGFGSPRFLLQLSILTCSTAPYLISLQSPAFLGVLIFVWYGLKNLLLLLENFYLYVTNIVCNVEIPEENMLTKYLKVMFTDENGQCNVRFKLQTKPSSIIYYFQTSPPY